MTTTTNNNDHITENEMILHYYDEAASGAAATAIDAHLRVCEECQTRFDALEKLLASVNEKTVAVPERGELYGQEVWNRIRGRLAPSTTTNVIPMRRPQMWRTWAAVAAMLVVGVSGYMLGRRSAMTEPTTKVKETAASTGTGGAPNDQFEAGRRRVLFVALTDHFERSQMVLAELSNASPGEAGKMDIRYERDTANDLLDSNRLFRQAAMQQGDAQAAGLLDDLERTLLEVAHSPENVGSGEFEALRRRIEDQGLVFKVKVLRSRLERQNNKL